MPATALDVLVAFAALVVLAARPAAALGVLVFAAVLVPSPMALPVTHSAYVTVDNVLVGVGALRLLFLHRRQRVPRPTAPTGAHVAIVLVLAVAYLVGIAFVVNPGGSVYGGSRLVELVNQAVFFLLCLGLVRRLARPRQALVLLCAALVTSCVIATLEHVSTGSYGHWLFSRLPGQGGTDAAYPLDVRRGAPRVRAGTEFALQFGWMSVTMMPALLAVAMRSAWRRYTVPAGVGFVALCIYWSDSRSALIALPLVVVATAVLAGGRRFAAVGIATTVASATLYLAVPALGHALSSSADQGSSLTARFVRLAPILHDVAAHPLRGLGLGNLPHTGFATTDNSLLLDYTELGVFGALALALLFLTVIAHAGRVVSACAPEDRSVAAACTAGVAAFVVSAQLYDAFQLLQSTWVLWVLVSVATVVAERSGHPLTLGVPRLRRTAAVGAAGLVLGGLAYVAAPVHHARTALFTTLPASREQVPYDPFTAGKRLALTACDLMTTDVAELPGVAADCTLQGQAAGVGILRLQAPTAAALNSAGAALSAEVRRVGVTYLTVYPLEGDRAGRDTVWATAPVWAPLAALGAFMLLPWRLGSWPPAPRPPAPERSPAGTTPGQRRRGAPEPRVA